MTWPESALVKIPEGIPFEIAAVTTDAVTTCYHALCERVSVKEGDTVLIMGVGGLGINAIQIAKALVATVIAAARNEKKLEMAKNCGADYVFSTTAVNLPEGTASARLELTVGCWYKRNGTNGWTFDSRAEQPGDMPQLT